MGLKWDNNGMISSLCFASSFLCLSLNPNTNLHVNPIQPPFVASKFLWYSKSAWVIPMNFPKKIAISHRKFKCEAWFELSHQVVSQFSIPFGSPKFPKIPSFLRFLSRKITIFIWKITIFTSKKKSPVSLVNPMKITQVSHHNFHRRRGQSFWRSPGLSRLGSIAKIAENPMGLMTS